MRRIQSFETVKRKRLRVVKIVGYIFILFVSYELFTAYFFKTWLVSSISMEPSIKPNDGVITSPSAYGIYKPFSDNRFAPKPPSHGDLVLLRLKSTPAKPWYLTLANSLVRFASFQTLSIFSRDEFHVVKRVVACPGDVVMMKNFIAYIKVKGSDHFLTEYEVSGKKYDIDVTQTVPTWSTDMCLAGTMNALELGNDEFFVLGDNRTYNSDSRFFGPVNQNNILAKIVLKFWPLSAFSKM